MKSLKFLVITTLYVIFVVAITIEQAKENNLLKQMLAECEVKRKTLTDSIYQLTKLTDENILFWCKYFDIKYPQVVLAQMKLETGHFTSELCLQANNLIGMKHPKKT